MKRGSAVIVTASGKRGFLATFGIGVPEETAKESPSFAKVTDLAVGRLGSSRSLDS
jgi:hypothetical protein